MLDSVKFLLLVLTWSVINLSMIPGMKAFDPFPFGILALVISSEGVVLTIFVLMSQNRMAHQAERTLSPRPPSWHARGTGAHGYARDAQDLPALGIDVESAKRKIQGFSDATDVGKLASDLEIRLPH